eukprot:1147752-Pleurochrysis_carterae.AAC.1
MTLKAILRSSQAVVAGRTSHIWLYTETLLRGPSLGGGPRLTVGERPEIASLLMRQSNETWSSFSAEPDHNLEATKDASQSIQVLKTKVPTANDGKRLGITSLPLCMSSRLHANTVQQQGTRMSTPERIGGFSLNRPHHRSYQRDQPQQSKLKPSIQPRNGVNRHVGAALAWTAGRSTSEITYSR